MWRQSTSHARGVWAAAAAAAAASRGDAVLVVAPESAVGGVAVLLGVLVAAVRRRRLVGGPVHGKTSKARKQAAQLTRRYSAPLVASLRQSCVCVCVCSAMRTLLALALGADAVRRVDCLGKRRRWKEIAESRSIRRRTAWERRRERLQRGHCRGSHQYTPGDGATRRRFDTAAGGGFAAAREPASSASSSSIISRLALGSTHTRTHTQRDVRAGACTRRRHSLTLCALAVHQSRSRH